MQLPRVVSLFLVFLTFGLLASSTAVKRASAADVTTVLNELKTSTGAVLPQISALGTSGKATQANIAPLITQLTASLNTAQSSLTSLQSGGLLLEKRQAEEVAVVLAGIISETTLALDTLVIFGLIPAIEFLLISVDIAIQEILRTVDILVIDVLITVAGLLRPVLGLLSGVGLGGVLGLL